LISDKCTDGSVNNSIGYWFGSVMTKRSEEQFLLNVGQHKSSLLSH